MRTTPWALALVLAGCVVGRPPTATATSAPMVAGSSMPPEYKPAITSQVVRMAPPHGNEDSVLRGSVLPRQSD